MAPPSGMCWARMTPMGPAVPRISASPNLVPAAPHAAPAARNFAESPVGQIIPIKGATHPQPGGALPLDPTADGGEPADAGPIDGGSESGAARPSTSDIASASE